VVQIVAIRINSALRFAPDYRPGVAEGSYQANGLDEVLETVLEEFEYLSSEFEELIGEIRSSVVELPTGRYLVCMMPAPLGC
jgi:hypothetical protein